MRKPWLVISAFLGAACLHAQEFETRAAEIEAARDKKSKELTPDSPSKWESRLILFKDMKILERFSYGLAGFRVALGQMGTGGGFALGPDYLREDLARGEVQVHAGAYASASRWTKFVGEVGARSFARDKMFWSLNGVYHNYNSIPYYGPGPDSNKTGRSNFRFEDFAVDTTLGFRPVKPVRFGASAGHLRVNTGPGRAAQYISAERIYPSIPGIDNQADFNRWGGFFQIDYRDSELGPRSGGNYFVRYDDYQDRTLGRHSFRQIDAEVHQFIPFFNKRRVIALRGRTVFTHQDQGNTVPFYMQQVLGGSDDLRGYRPYRFYGDHMIVMNAEYRWEVFSGLDMAVFADAGKVAMRRAEIKFNDLESSVGFGFRFNARNATFIRLDFGFSHEGFMMWLKFSGLFNPRPMGASTPSFIR